MKCLHSLMIIMDSFLGQHNPSNYFALTAIWLVFGLIAVSGVGMEIKQLLNKTGGNLNEISNGTFI